MPFFDQQHLSICYERFGSAVVAHFVPMVLYGPRGPSHFTEDYGGLQPAREVEMKIVGGRTIRVGHVETSAHNGENSEQELRAEKWAS